MCNNIAGLPQHQTKHRVFSPTQKTRYSILVNNMNFIEEPYIVLLEKEVKRTIKVA